MNVALNCPFGMKNLDHIKSLYVVVSANDNDPLMNPMNFLGHGCIKMFPNFSFNFVIAFLNCGIWIMFMLLASPHKSKRFKLITCRKFPITLEDLYSTFTSHFWTYFMLTWFEFSNIFFYDTYKQLPNWIFECEICVQIWLVRRDECDFTRVIFHKNEKTVTPHTVNSEAWFQLL